MAVSSCCFHENNLYINYNNSRSGSDNDKAFCYTSLLGFDCYHYWFKTNARVSIASRRLKVRGSSAASRFKSYPNDLRVVENNNTINSNVQSRSGVAEIPISCYQILGVSDQAEKDEIVKSAMHLKNAEIEEGYTMDAVLSRQNLLMDVRDKLLFEPEYAGNTREKVPPKSSLQIPWAWLPGALCLLQEVGEEKLVLDIGRKALQHPDAKPYIHDLLLSMALAECAIAKVGFEKNNISQGFEALARAQCLLRSKISLGKMTLLSQIEESLEELAPACTLELLGMPHTPENAERRLGAIAALRELLRQGLDVETSCQVQDWPCFLNQALSRLMATEIVELFPWDNLAATRKNKKSIESQNQRVVVDFNCFYTVLIAHIALGFSSKQKDLIDKAKIICECLIASEGIDLKFEEAFCLFLLGQGNEAVVAEKLEKLELSPNSISRNPVLGKETRDVSKADQSLELWLKDAVLSLFPDTRDCSASLVNFFSVGKHAPGNRQNKRAPQNISSMSHRSLSHVPARDRRVLEDTASCTDSSRHLGPVVKQLAPPNFQGPLTDGKTNSVNNFDIQPVQLKRSLGSHQSKVWSIWLGPDNVVGKIIFVTAMGCILFATSKLMGMQLRMRTVTSWGLHAPRTKPASSAWTRDSSRDQCLESACSWNKISGRLKKLFPMLKMQLKSGPKVTDLNSSCLTASLSTSKPVVCKRQMPMEEAETLVRQWQAIKADALGPSHQIHGLFEVLDESMLIQWQAMVDEARSRSCFWRFVLLQMSVKRADILSDGTGKEMAEIEALLEEAAELVDESQPKNPNYYSTYIIRYVLKRQADGSWKFCESDIHTP